MLNLNHLKKLYTSSPLWMKKLYASIPYDVRNGREYREWRKFLNKSIDEDAYQLLKLKETLLYAYKNTLYYKKTFDAIDFNIHDFKKLEDIQYLPYINKEIVRENYHELIATNYPKKRTFFVTTGGSSGEPMQFLQSKNIWAKELAFVNHFFKSYGYTPKHLKASFRGGEFQHLKDNYWKINPIHHEIHFSPFHINTKTIEIYIQQLNRLQPKFIHTYPSAILSLIEHMKQKQLTLHYQIHAIFLISENFSKHELDTISNFFHCQVTSFFGHSERLIFTPLDEQCEYKINQKYGYVELINQEKKVIHSSKETGELVGTSFDNFAMPLIRYRTEDFTAYKNDALNSFELIQGRWEKEYLEGKDGLQLTLTALNMHSEIFNQVTHFQFLQEEIGETTLIIVPKKNFTDNDRIAILDALHQKAGHALSFTIKLTDTPLLTARGKLKKLIKNIPK
jgi:phenylacetate-CoA ligase